ncbi:MAG: hypothetical protein JXA74_05250 [Anaerolineae bacterium]|nr:hypothetical protein [Anaerolineae bacterium]
MSTDEKQRLLRSLWRDKMHVEPHALDLAPSDVRARFEHIWAPADEVMVVLADLPLGWLRVWEQNTRGHLLFGLGTSTYQPGPLVRGERILESVCHLSLVDLVRERRAAMLPILCLLDHLLGSGAQAGGPWLSDGAGLTEPLREVGARFARIHALGYGHERLGASGPHDYFAQTLWLFLSDPGALNTLDPLAHKLYARTLWDEAFWRRASPH